MTKKFEPFQQVLVRDTDNDNWVCHIYSNYDGDPDCPHMTIGGDRWKQCIPFTGNEHLLGTTESPEPIESFKFGDKVMVRNSRYDEWQKAIFIRDYIPDGDPKQCYQVTVLRENHLNSYSNFFIVKKGWDNE